MKSETMVREASRSYIGSAAWGQINRGRLTGSERVRFTLQIVHAQLKLWLRHAGSWESQRNAQLRRIDLTRIALPDTLIVKEALELLHRTTPDWLCSHTLRTWSWAMIFAQIDGLKPDHEVLTMSCLLHDLALTPTDSQAEATGCACFAIEGGHLAARFLASRCWEETRIKFVEEAICLHMNPLVTVREGVEAHLLHEAAALDVVGARRSELPARTLEVVLERHPRADFNQQMATAMGQQASECPESRTAVLWRLGLERAIQTSGWT